MERLFLNIGRGDRVYPGFFNVAADGAADVRLDVRKGLPFPSHSVQGIYSHHFIEHLDRRQVIRLFREFRRVLTSDGTVRIATLDLEQVIDEYIRLGSNQSAPSSFHGISWFASRSEFVNALMHFRGRQWIYDQDELVRLATLAGLSFRGRFGPGQSDVSEFSGLEHESHGMILEFVPVRRVPTCEKPLVSVLIPAYNPRFFVEALDSALGQTYQDLEIIVSDDCPTDDIYRIVEARRRSDPRVAYHRNVPRLGDIRNYLRLIELARGEYLKFLNDDDRLHPTAIERMVEILNQHGNVTLVTSHRQLIDAAGRTLPDIAATRRIVSCDQIIDGVSCVDTMLSSQLNFVGEPTTVMFRAQDIEVLKPDLFHVGGYPITYNSDVALYVNLLSMGDLAYLTETLSSFRWHEEQTQRQPGAQEKGIRAWQELREHGYRLGFLESAQDEQEQPAREAASTGGSDPRPEVSIVIPTYNNWRHTESCLKALLANTSGASFEIIIVDNASSDETRQRLAEYQGKVRVHLNDKNLGFAKACNQGAQLARGHFILFLNNDTEPQPGWLEPLVEALRSDPDVAVAGSKLIFPDGTLQHAGVEIRYADPHPIMPVHRRYGQPAAASRERREVRCVTGACLVIRRDVWEQVGGFDEAYVNGYEDVDLCFKVAEAGGRILYVPESVVIHHESKTDGRFKHVRENIELLHRRWIGRFNRFDVNRFEGVRSGQNPERPGVSLVVNLAADLHTIAPCLESLWRFTGSQDEIIIINTGPADAGLLFARRFAEAHGDRVKLLDLQDGESLGTALALGAEVTNRPYLAWVSSDVEVGPGWLDALVLALECTPGLSGVSPAIADQQTPPTVRAGLSVASVPALDALCYVVRREPLAQVGGVDPHFTGMIGEVLDLSFRLRQHGYHLGRINDVVVRSYGVQRARQSATASAKYLGAQDVNRLFEKLNASHSGAVPNWVDLFGEGAPEPQTGLVSIIVLAYNNFALTRECIESVYLHTRRPFELILVDNGSADDFAGYARQLSAEYGNVKYIRNDANEGYAYGCNQGLQAATGEFVVLLNNDVVVTPGWLSRQLAAFAADPIVGIVSPRTNYASGVQQVPEAKYSDMAGMIAFAEEWHKAHRGQLFAVPRLTGLCMVISREVLEKVGGLDTAFGIGNFEDDDLCLRVLRAGYKLVLANDVFVHHYGSRTFRILDTDYARLMRVNQAIFAAKWGIFHGQPYDSVAVAASKPFDVDLDFIPIQYSEVFHPGAPPLDLGEARAVRLLCIADPSGDGWKAAVRTYLQTFSPGDDVSLVVRAEPLMQEHIESVCTTIEDISHELGLADETMPDVIIEATWLPPRSRGSLYTAAQVFLAGDGFRARVYQREAEACGCQTVADLRPEALRQAVERVQHQRPTEG